MNLENLTKQDVEKIFGVILDSSRQDEFMNNPDSEDYWMLGFVFDSKLLENLEKYSEKLDLEEKLLSKKAESLKENGKNKV